MGRGCGKRDVTSADPAILLQQVATGAGAQEAASGVLRKELAWGPGCTHPHLGGPGTQEGQTDIPGALGWSHPG